VGAGESPNAFGRRFVLDAASYPLAVQAGQNLPLNPAARNTGGAPFPLNRGADGSGAAHTHSDTRDRVDPGPEHHWRQSRRFRGA
jgi:hypothetical protein